MLHDKYLCSGKIIVSQEKLTVALLNELSIDWTIYDHIRKKSETFITEDTV
jgi:hypothetical protein